MLRFNGMRLPVAIMLSLVGTVSGSSLASADACTCADAGWEDLMNAPVSEATPGDEAVSQPVDVISSQEVVVVEPEAPEKVLWCESSDDPRCAPIQGTNPAPELTMPSPGELARTVAPRATTFPTSRRTANEGLAASVGARFELERPPQG